MATGWAGDGAVQDQIDATVDDAIARARRQLRHGPGLEHCEECDAPIPLARRQAVPGVRLWNAQVAWQVPGLGDSEVALGVNNLADKRLFREANSSDAGAATYNEPGRAYWASLRFGF